MVAIASFVRSMLRKRLWLTTEHHSPKKEITASDWSTKYLYKKCNGYKNWVCIQNSSWLRFVKSRDSIFKISWEEKQKRKEINKTPFWEVWAEYRKEQFDQFCDSKQRF